MYKYRKAESLVNLLLPLALQAPNPAGTSKHLVNILHLPKFMFFQVS